MFVGPEALGQPVLICNQCVDLCCDIVTEKRPDEPWLVPKKMTECPACKSLRPSSSMVSCCTTCFARARAPADVLPPPHPVAIPAALPTLPPAASGTDFACSFCHRPRSLVRALISGPHVFVCDLCVTEFALELEPRYWWPWERPRTP